MTESTSPAATATIGNRLHEVTEFVFDGPKVAPMDHPTANIDLAVTFEHEDSGRRITVQGFWDGDGRGRPEGQVFKARFTPTLVGRWRLVETASSDRLLQGQREGETIMAEGSCLPGFWLVDADSADGRWFKRSNGVRPYFVGNTHYDFLFRPYGLPATAETIRQDIRDNAAYFGKLRACIMQPREENAEPELLPFFDQDGHPTEKETDQPNPAFFTRRVDVAVLEAARHDLIFDLIMGGTTGDQVATKDGFIKYICARYGAYPNVWLTIGQEWNEQVTAEEEIRVGNLARQWLPYPTPVSTHATAGWTPDLNGDWHTHAILQGKIPSLQKAAQAIRQSYAASSGKPTVNDENGYDPGEASTGDVIEGILGSFLGGGYASTGNKTAGKQGGYFWGHAALGQRLAEAHPSARHLKFLRDAIQENLPFWRLSPVSTNSPHSIWIAPQEFPAMADRDQIHVLGSNRDAQVSAALKAGAWKLIQIDAMAMASGETTFESTGAFTFSTPNSRAVLNILIHAEADFSLPLRAEFLQGPIPTRSPLRILTRSEELEAPTIHVAFADDLEVSGGTPPYRRSIVSGRLPPGLKLEGSEISGTPTEAGTFHFTFQVEDRAGDTVQRTFEITVSDQ